VRGEEHETIQLGCQGDDQRDKDQATSEHALRREGIEEVSEVKRCVEADGAMQGVKALRGRK